MQQLIKQMSQYDPDYFNNVQRKAITELFTKESMLKTQPPNIRKYPILVEKLYNYFYQIFQYTTFTFSDELR